MEKKLSEYDFDELLELALQLRARSLMFPSEEMHNAAVAAHEEVKKRFGDLEAENEALEKEIKEHIERIEALEGDVAHYQKYAMHHPTCVKVVARQSGVGIEKDCTCGLDKKKE